MNKVLQKRLKRLMQSQNNVPIVIWNGENAEEQTASDISCQLIKGKTK